MLPYRGTREMQLGIRETKSHT